MKWKRWLLFATGALLLLAVVLLITAHFYLRSSAMARKAEEILQETLGVPVKVREAAVGLVGSSSARGIELYEPNNDTPWLSLDEIQSNLSLIDLLRGDADGGKVTVRGAKVRLRFDAQGRLLTELPKPSTSTAKAESPSLTIEGGELSLEQVGRQPMVVTGVSAGLKTDAGRWGVTGKADDPTWGEWSIAGHSDLKTGAVVIELRSDRAEVTPARLRALPFVSPGVWDQVTGEGPARIAVIVRVGGDHGIRYRVEVEPLGAAVQVSSIGLASASTTGTIVVEDGLVTLRGLRGRAAGGDLEARGDLDFRPEPWKFTVTASTKGVDLQPFTRSWPLPTQLRGISGRLTGEANLVLNIGDRLQVTGTGQGRVEDAILQPKKPGDEPIKINDLRLRLFYVDGKPQFSTEMSSLPRRANPLAPLAVLLLMGAPQPAGPPPQRGSVEQLLAYPAQAAGWVQWGIEGAIGLVVQTGKKAVAALPRTGKAKPPGTGPTYFEASFGLKDVDLGQLVQRLGVPVPFAVGGRGSVQVKVALPVETPNDIAAYRLNGSINLSHVKLAGLELDKVEAVVKLDRGVLELEKLRGEVPDATPGTFQGSARMQVAPLGALTAGLTLDNIPVARVLSLAPALAKDAAGSFSGSATFRAPADKLQDPTAWDVRGTARAAKLRIVGLAIEHASTVARLERGELTLTETTFGVDGLRADATASLTLRESYPFKARVDLDEIDLSAVKRLTPGLTLPLSVEGRLTAGTDLSGTLAPFKLESAGKLAARKLKLGDVTFEELKTGWKFEERKLSLDGLSAQLYKGTVTGSAALPLGAKESGTVDLAVQGLDVSALVKDLKGFPLKMGGEASGKLAGTLSEAGPGGEREFTARLNLEAPKLRVQNVPAEKIRARVGYRQGVVNYKVEGDALGGTFELDGRWPAAPKPPVGELEQRNAPADPPRGTEGTIKFRQARLGRLTRALAGLDTPPPLRGIIDLDVRYGTDEKGELRGAGKLLLRDLRWGNAQLATSLAGAVRLHGDIVDLPEFGGEAAGGQVRLRARFHLKNAERSWFSVRLEHVESARLAVLVPGAESAVQGPVDLRMHAELGREWHGSGEAHLLRGRVGPVDVSEWRLPFRFSYAPDAGSGQVSVDDSAAQLGSGRATVRVTLGWGYGLRLEGLLTFRAVQVHSLGRKFVELERQLGAGWLSGRVEFSGREVHSFNDVNASVEVDFAQTQALQLPVLREITPYLRGVTTATSFEKGDLRATLSRGIWRVRRLALLGRFANLIAEGTVTGEQGRLDLQVTARTGELVVNPVLLRLVSLSLGQPLSLELLTRSSEWLSNRVIHLRVAGTINNPDIRIERIRLLTDEAVRFFLLQAARPAPAAP